MIRNFAFVTVRYLRESNFRNLATISLSMWLMALLTKSFQNGLSFGLDYGVFQPDGANYYFRTLSFLTRDDLTAAQKVSTWYQENGVKLSAIDPKTLLPENNPVWYLSAPRVLYPILSIPFVFALGGYGMLVVPSLSLLGVFLTINWLSLKYRMQAVGLTINFVLAASITVSRWFISNITDGLLTVLIGFYAALIIARRRLSLFSYLSILVLLVILSSATRFSFPIWFFLGLATMLQKRYLEGAVIWVTSFICLIPLLLLGIGSAVLPSENGSSWFSKLTHLPLQSGKVVFFEIAQLIVLDKVFLLFLVFGFYCAWKIRRTQTGLQVISVAIGVLAIGFINGTVGVNFRYQLPVIVFLALAIFEYFEKSSFLGARNERMTA